MGSFFVSRDLARSFTEVGSRVASGILWGIGERRPRVLHPLGLSSSREIHSHPSSSTLQPVNVYIRLYVYGRLSRKERGRTELWRDHLSSTLRGWGRGGEGVINERNRYANLSAFIFLIILMGCHDCVLIFIMTMPIVRF